MFKSFVRRCPIPGLLGSKSFKIMAIDIHTVKDNRLVTAHHLEDWASAIRQLSVK